MNRFVAAIVSFVLPSFVAIASARADEGSIASQHFNQAMQLLQQGEVAPACQLFEQSLAEDPAPGTLSNLSLCRERQGRFDEAHRGYSALAEMADKQGLAEKAASVRAHAKALEPKLARLDLARRPDVQVAITGVAVDDQAYLATAWTKPLFVMPGAHRVVIKHADGVVVTRDTGALAPGDARSIVVDDASETPSGSAAQIVVVDDAHPRPEATRVDGTRRATSYVVGGIGIGFVAAGAAFGVGAFGKKSDAKSACNAAESSSSANVCRPSVGDADPASTASHELRLAKTYDALSTVGFGVGAAAIGAGVYLFLTSRRASDAPTSPANAAMLWPSFEPRTGGGSALLSGTF